MCGINLIVAAAPADLRPTMQQMMQKTAFRGPDANNELYFSWEDQELALGANRLRIVDRDAASDQPMQSACGNYLLAYNGEVYNYHDLKTVLLRQGQGFRTSSDTEVLLYWLQHKGAEGLAQLKGMFALVFIDLVNKKIIFARDSHGIKPLFYSFAEGNLLVSSSLKAIAATGLHNKSLNPKAVQEYLAFRHVLGPKTFFQGVQAVAPGSYLVYHQAGITQEKFHASPRSRQQVDLKEALVDALTLTTATSEPAGLFLSGGLDSTLLLALYRYELGYHGMPAYTLNTGTDAEWAAKAAKQFNAEHTPLEVGLPDMVSALDFFDGLDQPIADHGAVATWLIAKQAANKHRVILSGAGADELFAGYNRHRAFDSYLRHRTSWLNYKKFASSIGYFAHPSQLKTYLKAISSDASETFQNFLSIHGIDSKGQYSETSDQNIVPVKNLSEALEFDQRQYLINDVLAISDYATMRQGIEVRVPYLYDDVVWSAGQISVKDKIKQRGKAPLKDLLCNYEGKAFVKRQKMGFGLPMAEYMRDEQFPLWSVLQEKDPVFEFVSRPMVNRMIKHHQRGKGDWNMQLWSILVLSHWLKRNFS